MSLQFALVVDDSKLARITLQRLLQKHHLTVEVVESGIAALKKLETSQPDIIFMDHLMPELDGFEATKKIKANPATAHIPVIMCTGKEGVDNYDEQARSIGASGTLSKPPQADQLSLVLAAAKSGETLATSAPITKAAKPRPATAPDLSGIFERLGHIEDATRSLPSFDALQDRLANAETSVTTVQESLISLREAVNEPPLLTDEVVSSVKNALQDDFRSQLDDVKSNAIDSNSLKEEVIRDINSDDFTARLVDDAESRLKPQLEEELKQLELKVTMATDEAVTQTNNRLEELQESLHSMADNQNPVPETPDLTNIMEQLRSEATTIAADSARTTVDSALTERLQEFSDKLQGVANRITELDEKQEATAASITQLRRQQESRVSSAQPELPAESSSASGAMIIGGVALVAALAALAKAFGVF